MKSSIFIKLLLATSFFLIWSVQVFALAGFSEINSILHYNNFADIMWAHPSDACSPYGHYCFYLIEKNKIDHPFNGALQKMSIPAGQDSPFVFMESMRDQWIIYDLELKGILFESDDFESAYQKWKDWSFPQLEFVNATNLSDYFQETEESKEKNKTNWSEVLLWFIVFIFYFHWKFWFGASLVFLLILGVHIHERYYSLRII